MRTISPCQLSLSAPSYPTHGVQNLSGTGRGLEAAPHPGEVLQAPGVHVIHPRKDILVISAQLEELQLRPRREFCARAAVADQVEDAGYQPCNAQHLYQCQNTSDYAAS